MKNYLFALICLCFFFSEGAAQRNLGMDMSLLPKYEEHNKPYLDKDGKEVADMLMFMPEVGVNTIRVRLFVNPTQKNQKGQRDVAVCQDLEYVKAYGKRIKESGLKFMLDLHYSDTWADPSYQLLPETWKDCKTTDEKAQRVYDYTTDVLQQLCEAGATPDLVQVGNEISYGIIGIGVHPYDKAGDDWDGMLKVLENGCKAVREVCPEAKIVIHTERSGNSEQTIYFYNKLANLDYDIIGLSYYPFWHGDLSALEKTLAALGKDFAEKEVQIVETAYNFQFDPDGVKFDLKKTWPYTPEGQKKFIEDLVSTLNKYNNVSGLYYWFPEEAGNGDDSDWNNGGATVLDGWCNRGLWKSEENGKGHECNPGLYSLKGFDVSAIEEIKEVEKDGNIYNFSGQKISVPAEKQIFIKNGKKYIR